MQGGRGGGGFDDEEEEDDEVDDSGEVDGRQTRYAFSAARFLRKRARKNASAGEGKRQGRSTRSSQVRGHSHGSPSLLSIPL